jgi:hypothetical protein
MAGFGPHRENAEFRREGGHLRTARWPWRYPMNRLGRTAESQGIWNFAQTNLLPNGLA